jgi:hypothetical protein
MMILDEYQPGTVLNACYLCKAARRTGERIVDTGIHIDFEGFVAICGSCIEEAASGLGLLSARQADKLRTENTELSRRYVEAQIRADAAEAALDALRRYEHVRPEPTTPRRAAAK